MEKTLLERIKGAIDRMEKAGHGNTVYCENLRNKAARVEAGEDLKFVNVAEQVIKQVSGQIANISRGSRERNTWKRKSFRDLINTPQ